MSVLIKQGSLGVLLYLLMNFWKHKIVFVLFVLKMKLCLNHAWYVQSWEIRLGTIWSCVTNVTVLHMYVVYSWICNIIKGFGIVRIVIVISMNRGPMILLRTTRSCIICFITSFLLGCRLLNKIACLKLQLSIRSLDNSCI